MPPPIAPTVPAPEVTAPKDTGPKAPRHPLPKSLIESARRVERVPFHPKKHLAINDPEKIYTMEEIGRRDMGISTTATSTPFSLFTREAVEQMRAEIFSEPVLRSCQYESSFAKNLIRGYGPRLAPFTFNAWNCPQVLEHVSKIAGVDLIPAFDVEVGQINISVNDSDTELHSNYAKTNESAFAWHFDSYAFVCVAMLSDCTGMEGGETAIKTGTGEIMKVRGPSQGTAIVLQGRYIKHQALKAHGGRERITMVTSFRPRNPLVRDDATLKGVRPVSNLPELYSQFIQYRLSVLAERLRIEAAELQEKESKGQDFETDEVRSFLIEQSQFLSETISELK